MNRVRFLFCAALCALCVDAAAQRAGVSADLASCADYGTIGLGASYAPGTHWTLDASLKYNPFTFRGSEGPVLNRQRSARAGVRYWPWHVFSGWWMSAALQYQEFCRGGVSSSLTTEGDRYGGAFGAGYSYMLGRHFNLDLGIGLRGGYEVYASYSCPTCGALLEQGAKYFVVPDDLVLSISYIF